ncbi:MAG: bifunctional hydroxymethylpyrimidine kinase/phosphomethylpyrimidine kinase [Candidatus Sumerlaeaceae bacterium]|nr:bifunctional hydroxymethylpyrimidine kinase/phosphomethylpyrimidine kinase [Candidatus Sumerlaeaceae bacterium]
MSPLRLPFRHFGSQIFRVDLPSPARDYFLMIAPNLPARCLTIAGSDSGGGAGIQGDLKTFTVLGAYGMTAITALTAQNTIGVTMIHEVPPAFVAEQIRVVVDDIGCDAAKTGMLANAAVVQEVARIWKDYPHIPLVVDPVMVSTTGARLLAEDAVSVLMNELLPLATIVTPNMPEAEILAGIPITDPQSAVEAANRIRALGATAVLLKGGDAQFDNMTVYDVFVSREFTRVLTSPRITTPHTHGSGCALAAAICVGLAQGLEPLQAVMKARQFVKSAINHAVPLGKGHASINHLAAQNF